MCPTRLIFVVAAVSSSNHYLRKSWSCTTSRTSRQAAPPNAKLYKIQLVVKSLDSEIEAHTSKATKRPLSLCVLGLCEGSFEIFLVFGFIINSLKLYLSVFIVGLWFAADNKTGAAGCASGLGSKADFTKPYLWSLMNQGHEIVHVMETRIVIVVLNGIFNDHYSKLIIKKWDIFTLKWK